MSDKNEPLISIIIAVYNGEKYLCECLDSAIKQDYKNLEIILVDDGSKDSSRVIICNYAKIDGRIQSLYQENMGVSTARNRGLECAKGEYICIVDQDDCLSEDYISYFYQLIVRFDAEIAYTPSADKFFGKIHSPKSDGVEALISGIQATEEMLYHKIVIAPWNKMISRELIKQHHIRFQPDFFGGEGFAFSIDCFQRANRVAVGNRKVYHYRVGDPESGASKFRLSTIHSSINAQQYIRRSLPENTPALWKAWQFSNWHTHCDCLNIMVGCGVVKQDREEYEALEKVCRKEALCALRAPVSAQQKLRGLLFRISPCFAAHVINCFRVRRFAKITLGGKENL